jgi:hypothetical protein
MMRVRIMCWEGERAIVFSGMRDGAKLVSGMCVYICVCVLLFVRLCVCRALWQHAPHGQHSSLPFCVCRLELTPHARQHNIS